MEPPEASEGDAPRPRRTGSGSGHGIGEVVIRALDPRLRSAMVVEDGVRRVVISWYHRSPLREVCVTIPEATVPEFERRANELTLVSLSLTDRRRRARRTNARPDRPLV